MRIISPFRAKSSSVSLFQNASRVPVNFSFPIVCSVPLSEKKLVSPEKKEPLTGSSSPVRPAIEAEVAGASKAELGVEGCDSSRVDCSRAGWETGALHHASPVAPALAAIPAVSATSDGDGGASLVSNQAGFLLAAGSGSGWGQAGSNAVD